MKRIKLFKQITSCMLVLLLAIPFSMMPKQIEESIAAESLENNFEPEELEQLLAPIALYPDALLAQILTAATYPLEVVEANRFVKENTRLTGEALLRQAQDQDWEPSVKAMLEFPDVLAMMDEQLEWTQKLGRAFLVQQSDCMDTVQRLRQKAYALGNLTSNGQQVIKVEPQTRVIIIQPAMPEIVYVPVYDTAIIYGNWWHPRYPPYHFYPRRYSGVTFFFGVFVVRLWGGWGAWDCNWHHHHVYVNLNHYNTFTRTYYRSGDHYRFYRDGLERQPWQHSSQYRTGAVYPRPASSLPVRPTTPALRQYSPSPVSTPRIISKENVRPTVNTVRVIRNNHSSIIRLPVARSKEVLSQRTKTKTELTKFSTPPARFETRNRVEKQSSVEAVTRDLRAQRVKTDYAVKSDVRDSRENQEIKRPPTSSLNHRRDDAQVLAVKAKGKGKQATVVLEQLQGAGVLRVGSKFVARKDGDLRSR